MAIMLQYNLYDSLTIQQIQKNTDITLEIVIEVLKILLKVKLLLCDHYIETKDDKQNDTVVLKPEYEIKLNRDYKNKRFRLNINMPIKSVTNEEDKRTHQQIDENRKYVVEVSQT